MKIKSIFLSMIVSTPFTSALALDVSHSPIQHVTLYPSAAKIERKLSVKAGEQVITLTGIAANFDINALQYQSDNVEVNAVSHVDSALDKPAGNESTQLRQKIRETEKLISEQSSMIKAAELQNTFLGNLTKGSASKVQRHAYKGFITIDQAKLKKEMLEQHLQELNQDLATIGDSQFNQRTLKFYVNAPQNGEIKISYLIPHARWQPTYKAELDTKKQRVRITRLAMIAQKTGEDWNNVKLTLSTSIPLQTIAKLQPEPWWVNYSPQATHATSVAKRARAMVPKSSARVSETTNSTPQFPEFEPTPLNFSTEYRSETKTNIPSSQQYIHLPLSTEEHTAKISIWVIPKQSLVASINAEIDQLDNQWPAGTVKLYRDGDFMGQQSWKNDSNGTMHMSFGYDDQIQISETEFLNSQTALDKDTNQNIQKRRYTIQNLHPYPIQITVFDSAPRSQNSELITHSQYSVKPTAEQWTNQPNIYQWQIKLNPKQNFQLDVEHLFKYPNKGHTSGF